MSKVAPFEKVKFTSDVKRLLERCATEDSEFLVKASEDILFGFYPDQLDGTGLHGKIIPLGPPPTKFENVVVNFALGPDRYFTLSDFYPLNERGILVMDQPFFKLERRDNFRVGLPDAMEATCNIIELRGKSVFVQARISDLSRGGLRLMLPLQNNLAIKIEDHMNFVIHIASKWRIELSGQVRYVKSNDSFTVFGIQFNPLDQVETRKMTSLTMELIREQLRAQSSLQVHRT